MERIGFFGGSFDPPHLGHEAIVRWALREKKRNQVWVVPCWEHPFGKELHSFEDRLQMCRLAFQKFGASVVVSDVEKKLRGTSFTARTIRHLQKEISSAQWFVIVGEDAYQERSQWKESQWLETNVQWLVIPRGKQSPIPDHSGTEIRKCIQTGKSWEHFVSKEVGHYYKRFARSSK